MKQEDLKNNDLSDENLEKVAGGAYSSTDVVYAFEPGDRVRCDIVWYGGRETFDATIVSKTFSASPDIFDPDYTPAYNVMPDGETETTKGNERFMQRI